MKKRLLQTMKKYAILLTIGVAYFVWTICTDIKIPCPFHLLTGVKCPACGITRMLVAIAKFRFVEAYSYNPFLFFHLPIILFCVEYSEFQYVKTGRRRLGKLSLVLWLEIILLIVFGVIRNILGV
jgi:hypothetical protein